MTLISSPYSRSNDSIVNNTIINGGFMLGQREGLHPDSGTLGSSGDHGMMGLVPSLLTIVCTTTQGDHMPYWITPDNDSNQVLLFADDYIARYNVFFLVSTRKSKLISLQIRIL